MTYESERAEREMFDKGMTDKEAILTAGETIFGILIFFLTCFIVICVLVLGPPFVQGVL